MFNIALIMTIFAVLHSLLAGTAMKQALRKRMGERIYYGFYRIVYNLVAIVTLIPAGFAVMRTPSGVVWQISGTGAVILLMVQSMGMIGVLVSLLQIDLARFAGLRQMRAYFSNEALPLPDEPLQMNGLYRFVRHPLYLFSLLSIWPMSLMTEGLLAFNIAVTLYFIFGSLLEERHLIAAFGKVYSDYQRRVPWLIPYPKRQS